MNCRWEVWGAWWGQFFPRRCAGVIIVIGGVGWYFGSLSGRILRYVAGNYVISRPATGVACRILLDVQNGLGRHDLIVSSIGYETLHAFCIHLRNFCSPGYTFTPPGGDITSCLSCLLYRILIIRKPWVPREYPLLGDPSPHQ